MQFGRGIRGFIGLALALTFVLSLFAAVPSQAVTKVDPATVKRRKMTIHRSLLNIYIAQKRKDDCLKEYPVMIALAPEDAKLRYEYGLFLARYANKAKAIGQLKKAASLDPTNPDISGALGTTYIQMKNYAEGCKFLRQAVAAGGDKYKKTYEDAYKYMQYQKQREIYKKKQEQYRKKMEARRKAAEKAAEDDDDDW